MSKEPDYTFIHNIRFNYIRKLIVSSKTTDNTIAFKQI